MMTMDTRNATSMPVPRRISSVPEKRKPYLTIFKRLAPAMTGIARIKVNLAATVRETPIISPPTIVAPEREVPGKIAAISWKRPMRKASGILEGEIPEPVDSGNFVLVNGLNNNEGNTYDDQGCSDDDRVVEVRVQPVVREDAHNARGNTGHQSLEPEHERRFSQHDLGLA